LRLFHADLTHRGAKSITELKSLEEISVDWAVATEAAATSLRQLAKRRNITVKEHRRAEVWLEDYGWVPVDPGDVRRVIRDEPPGTLTLESPKVVAARVTLFGAWEGNGVAYNMADDLALPGTAGVRVPYLARPLARSAAGWLDDLKSEGFSYKLTAKELPA